MDPVHRRHATVADLRRWFTIDRAPCGTRLVYAEDIQPQMVESITRRVQREGLQNVKPLLDAADDPRLPDGRIDAVLIVDTYHEMEEPVTLLRNVARALSPKGQVSIVDFTKKNGKPGPPMDERVDPERVIADAAAAGLRLLKRYSFFGIITCSCWVADNACNPNHPAFVSYQQRVDASSAPRGAPDASQASCCDRCATLLAPSEGARRTHPAERGRRSRSRVRRPRPSRLSRRRDPG
jgi:SAM-dependent methyltransferase